MDATMNAEKFKGGIREAVREALAEKEEANRLAKVEALLNEAETTINELTEAVSDKDTELAAATESSEALKAKVTELEGQLADFTNKLDEADKVREEVEERASAAEKELASIAAEARLSGRMAELDEAKIGAAEGESREAQEARVRELNDEEFAAYKSERVELRNQLAAEFKAAAEATAAEAAATSDKSDNDDAGNEVAPADIEKARKEEAAAAAAATLDVEVASESIKNKYLELANKMAERMSAGRE